MRLYYADIRDVNPALAKFPPTSASRNSALGTSLLAAAYEDYAGGVLPTIEKLITGKPVFSKVPNLHFSISHSKTHVFCALSNCEVGVDTEVHRKMNPKTIERLTTPEELFNLSFFDIWTLRESYFKLTGKGDLRRTRFYLKNGEIVSPDPNVKCRLYTDIENSSTAVCTIDGTFPDKIKKIPASKLLVRDGLVSKILNG